MRTLAFLACLAVALVALPVVAQEDDKREGYYYPPVESEEIFDRTLGEGPPTDRTVRVAFVNEVTRAQFDAASKPRFAVFAKGAEAEHMIITALDDDVFKTLFRARAVLAQMTASARQTDFFVKTGINLYATWFDLAKLMGYEDIVITDGETWSHRIVLK